MIDWNKPITTKEDMSDTIFIVEWDTLEDEEDGCFAEIRVEYAYGSQNFHDVYCVDYVTGKCINPYMSDAGFDIINVDEV